MITNRDNLCIVMDYASKGDLNTFIENIKKNNQGLFP